MTITIQTVQSTPITYKIVEIFESLQGEGFNTGMPSIFIRFGRCNLSCHWCDTNYNEFERLSQAEIWQKIRHFRSRNIIITGGEPTIQPHIEQLLSFLKSKGFFLAIETNGLTKVSPTIDYIATSPKRLYANRYEKECISQADEVRIVHDDDVYDFCLSIEKKIKADHYFLSPCEVNGHMNELDTITTIGRLNQRSNQPHWQLSIQSHKLANIE